MTSKAIINKTIKALGQINFFILIFFSFPLRKKVDLADYDKIILFGVQSMMPLIEQKIRDDCNRKQRSTTLIACRFPLPNWHPYMTFGSGVDQVWLYKYYPSYHSKK